MNDRTSWRACQSAKQKAAVPVRSASRGSRRTRTGADAAGLNDAPGLNEAAGLNNDGESGRSVLNL
jgi:hypothetical protein